MRWLSHRGGALDFQEWCQNIPANGFQFRSIRGRSSYYFRCSNTCTWIPYLNMHSRVYCGNKSEVVKCLSNDLEVPASAEIILEDIETRELTPEGPYSDHTGYYNEIDSFPVFTITHLTRRKDAIYHSTYTDVRLMNPQY